MLIVPSSGLYLWEWYYDLSEKLRRVHDGACVPIPPSEYLAWREATGNIVYPSEYAILSAMDAAYCGETTKELVDFRKRQESKQAAEAEKSRSRRGRRG